MRISIIGAGYVGLVTGACLAEKGHDVVCVDLDAAKVEKINCAVAPIYEKGLEELLRRNVLHRLRATTDLRQAVLNTEVSFLAVGTPSNEAGIDLTILRQATQDIGVALRDKNDYHVVAVKSTVIPGTTDTVVRPLLEEVSSKKAGRDFGVGMTPEFLREGEAISDCMAPDRIVLGAMDERTLEVLVRIFKVFSGVPQIHTSNKTAEMVKYATNSMLATLISFSNEIANLCASVPGIDAAEVFRGVHLDRRLTTVDGTQTRSAGITEYVWHGLGYGGSCLPKDVKALREFGQQLEVAMPLLDAVVATNSSQPLRLVAALEREMKLTGQRVAVLGLAFKPGTDDLRDSPALPVVKALLSRGARVVAHDPVAMPVARFHPGFSEVDLAADWQNALRGADDCCLVTRWPEYAAIQPQDFVALMRNPLVVDGRGLFDPHAFAAAGVTWRGIGYTPESASGRPPEAETSDVVFPLAPQTAGRSARPSGQEH